MQKSAPKKKNLFLPIILGLVAAVYSCILVINYGPRKRDFWDSMLRPKSAFELYEFDGLTDFGKTLAMVVPLFVFALTFYLVYHYTNKKKLSDDGDDDMEDEDDIDLV